MRTAPEVLRGRPAELSYRLNVLEKEDISPTLYPYFWLHLSENKQKALLFAQKQHETNIGNNENNRLTDKPEEKNMAKNPVTLHLFIDCAYHAHTIPHLLHQLSKINARLDAEALERLVLRFGNVYGSTGVHALHDADLIDERLKDKTLNSLAGHSVSEPCGCEPFISLQAAMYNR